MADRRRNSRRTVHRGWRYLSPASQARFDEAWGPIVDFRRDVIDELKAGNSANTFLRWMRKFLGTPPRS